jgi:hypothetical protein
MLNAAGADTEAQGEADSAQFPKLVSVDGHVVHPVRMRKLSRAAHRERSSSFLPGRGVLDNGRFQDSTQCFLAIAPVTSPDHPQGQCAANQPDSAGSRFCLELALTEASGLPHRGQANNST